MSIYVEPWNKPNLEDCTWYHTIDLPDGTVMKAPWDLRGKFDDYVGHVDLRGKRLLDIGTASGFLTWEAERAGATVVSFDLDHARRQRLLPFKDSIYCTDRAESERQREGFFNSLKRSYWYAHHSLGSTAKVFYGDIENFPRDLGKFDIALFGSVLEHLPDHIQAIGSAALLADTIIITGPLNHTEDRFAEFAGWVAHPEANYSFWRYSLGVYREVFGICGMQVVSVTKSAYRFMETQMEERFTIIATHI